MTTRERQLTHIEILTLALSGIALAVIGMLEGCAGAAPATQIVNQPVEVRVPVPVPCPARLPEEPIWLLNRLPAGATGYQGGAAAIGELKQRRAYEIQLKDALAQCLRDPATSTH